MHRGDGIDHRRAARLARDLADALDHAHRGGVVHRDVKPTNVILDESGRPRLIDFGLARRTDLDPTLTVEGTVLGTPAYMSPEQAAGFSHRADARSDIFSLGVLFHELLCGRRLPNHPSNLPAWRASSLGPLPPPRQCDRRVPRSLDRICRRAMACDPSDRYPDARSLADDLGHWLDRDRSGRGPHTWAARILVGSSFLILPVVLRALSPAPAPAPAQQAPGSPAEERQPLHPLSIRLPLKVAPKPAAGSKPEAVIALEDDHWYHAPGCPLLSRNKTTPRIPFPSASAARARKLVPCALCLPPKSAQLYVPHRHFGQDPSNLQPARSDRSPARAENEL